MMERLQIQTSGHVERRVLRGRRGCWPSCRCDGGVVVRHVRWWDKSRGRRARTRKPVCRSTEGVTTAAGWWWASFSVSHGRTEWSGGRKEKLARPAQGGDAHDPPARCREASQAACLRNHHAPSTACVRWARFHHNFHISRLTRPVRPGISRVSPAKEQEPGWQKGRRCMSASFTRADERRAQPTSAKYWGKACICGRWVSLVSTKEVVLNLSNSLTVATHHTMTICISILGPKSQGECSDLKCHYWERIKKVDCVQGLTRLQCKMHGCEFVTYATTQPEPNMVPKNPGKICVSMRSPRACEK